MIAHRTFAGVALIPDAEMNYCRCTSHCKHIIVCKAAWQVNGIL